MINGADRKQIPMLDSNSHAKRVPAASSSPNRISGFLKNCTETARSRPRTLDTNDVSETLISQSFASLAPLATESDI